VPAIRMKPISAVLALGLLFVSPCLAQQEGPGAYARGLDQYLAGNHDRAAATWRMAAVAGDARSAIGLGVLYENGVGVPRDTGEALRWFNYASALDASEAAPALARVYAAPRHGNTGASADVRVDLSVLDDFYQPAEPLPGRSAASLAQR